MSKKKIKQYCTDAGEPCTAVEVDVIENFKRAARRLQRCKRLYLFAADGMLHVMLASEQHSTLNKNGGMNQENVITTVNVNTASGAW